jgi:predicted amidohydrolase
MTLSIATAQFAPTTDKARNLSEIDALVQNATSKGAELVVLPEYATFTNPVLDDSFVQAAEPLTGETVTKVCRISRENEVAIVLGVNEPNGNGGIFNTLVAIDRGQIIATYRKIHLYDAFGVKESKIVTPGPLDQSVVFQLKDFSVGMQTCYDLRFPEVSRTLVDNGADLLALPAEWVPGPLKEFHWTTLLRARAIENTVYVAAADQSAPTGVGHSTVIDPMGVSIAMIADGTGLALAEIDQSRIQQVREINPALATRRFAVVQKG